METLIVSTFAASTMIFIFIQFRRITTEYDRTFHYNTVEGLYATQEINKYILNNDRSNVTDSISKITNMVKNVDVNSIKSHINTAQKAIDFVQDLTKKTPQNITNNLTKGPVAPRPLNKFFED